MENTIHASNAGTITVGDDTVNRIGFGAMRITGRGIWGPPPDEVAAASLLKRAVELGVNFIDTADAYGPEISERIIAATLKPYDGLVIATKGGLMRPGPDKWQPDCSPQHLREACEASLERLGVKQISVYQLHTVDPKVPFAESLQTLLDLQAEAKIKHIGLSNVEPENLKQALTMGKIVSVQNNYNLANREHEDVLKLCEDNKIAFIPYFPLGAGNLTASDGPLMSYARKYDATPGQIALAWLLAHSPYMLPIPGTSSMNHLEENIAATTVQLDDDDIRGLTALYQA